jgi:hypothetical protein
MKKTTKQLGIFALLTLLLFACKKPASPELEIAITGEETYQQHFSANIQEAWLNYTTKKSKSEWIKLPIQSGVYDLQNLFENDTQTVIMPLTKIDDAKTFIQVRFILADTLNTAITQSNDTLHLPLSAQGLTGVKGGINKAMNAGNKAHVTFSITADSTAAVAATPSFDPVVKTKKLVVVE